MNENWIGCTHLALVSDGTNNHQRFFSFDFSSTGVMCKLDLGMERCSVAFKMNTDELYVIGALQLQPQLTSNGDLLLNTYFQQLYVFLIPRRGCHQSRVVESMLLQLYIKFY